MQTRLSQNIGGRRLLLAGILLLGVIAFVQLGISPSDTLPSASRSSSFIQFVKAAFTPALDADARRNTAEAVFTTLQFAAIATTISVIAGLVLGFLGSTAWWPKGSRSNPLRIALFCITRAVITLMRSIHELLWALLFLVAIGFTHTAGVIAVAIPFSGTFAKIFSEMIDEAPREAADALGAAGASPLRVYLFGLLPQAIPDILAYTLYRFECALRASAVMGFFGVATFGYFLKLAFEDLNFPLVWTYLYALIFLVIIFDLWSATARRRIAH
ncbi:MAG: phosphonate transport system permease protein [Pseudoalteromonas tetraodonis]|jgi:phosphonate transport system permease protein